MSDPTPDPTPDPTRDLTPDMPDSADGAMADPQTHLDTDPVNDPDES